jgi:hypothetical protein
MLSTYEKSLRVYISRLGLFTFRFEPINCHWHVFKLRLVQYRGIFLLHGMISLEKKHYVISISTLSVISFCYHSQESRRGYLEHLHRYTYNMLEKDSSNCRTSVFRCNV